MENNMTLSPRYMRLAQWMEQTKSATLLPLALLRSYYAHVLERPISLRQTLQLLHAQVAFVFAVFPVEGPLALRLACCLWFAWAVMGCRRALAR